MDAASGAAPGGPSEAKDVMLLCDSDTEESSDEAPELNTDTRVLKMLYSGNIMELNKQDEQHRRGKVFNRRHDC